MYNNTQYRDIYIRQLTANKNKVDELVAEKRKNGHIDQTELLKLKEQRYLTPLFDDVFGYNERFRSPW